MADLAVSRKGFDGKWLNAELREILRRADPTAWQDGADSDLRARVRQVTGYLRGQLASPTLDLAGASPTSYQARLRDLLATLEQSTPTEATRTRWAAFLRDVHPVYEAARQQLPELGGVRAVRPTNIKRSLLHVTSASVAFAAISFSPTRTWLEVIAGAFVVYGWTMEISRRASPRVNAYLMRLYAPVAHAHESHQINSATWYATALIFLAIWASPFGALAGVAVLGLADPSAAFVGRRWGSVRLIAGRTLEGAIGFSVVAFGAILLAGWMPTLISGAALHALGWAHLCGIAAVAAVIGALVELVSGPIDDNLTIPMAVAAVVTLLGG